MAWLEFGITIYLSAVLIVAGMSKVVDQRWPASMRTTVPNSWTDRNVPRGIVMLLVIMEILAGLWLTVGNQLLIASFGVSALFISFVVVKILLFLRYRNIDCGCYGTAIASQANPPSIAVGLIQFGLAVTHFCLVANGMFLPNYLLRLSISGVFALFIALVLIRQFRYLFAWRNGTSSPDA